MKKNKLAILFFIVFIFSFTGCKYSFIVPENEPDIDPTVPTSFSTAIIPIFESKCVECHKSGDTSPYLTSTVAYSQIMNGFVNKTTPENSLIYTFPNPATSSHSWKKYSATEAALILKWIKEGANNN